MSLENLDLVVRGGRTVTAADVAICDIGIRGGRVVALGERLPPWKAVADTPWWAWSGGVLGGVFILLMILLLPSLGAATLIALVVTGQMAIAITLDHFGAFGLASHPVSLSRLAGAALLIAGVVLIKD